MNIQENRSKLVSNQYSLTSFGNVAPQFHNMLKQDGNSLSNDMSSVNIKSPPLIGLQAKEIPISVTSTLESKQVKEIYG